MKYLFLFGQRTRTICLVCRKPDWNVFEYKSPKDYLAPNDYYKGMALALLYKALEHAGLLTLDDFTLTFVSSRYPKDFLKMIRLTKDLQVEKSTPVPGIHQIYGERLPVQVLVLNGFSPEDTYMFSPFLTGSEPLRLDATRMLFRKYIDDPTNPYLEEMVDFKLRNRVMTEQEMEVLAQMATEVSTVEWERVLNVLEKSSLGRAMINKGKIEDKQEVIQEFLLRRFGGESPEIQREVQQLNDLELLHNVLTDLFASASLEEARDIIAAGVRKLPRKSEP